MAKSSIRWRTSVKNDVTTVKILITHPMVVARKDPKTKEQIQAHFIQEVVCEHSGKPVLNASWGSAIAKNPFFMFKVKGAKAGDKIKISWFDNTGKNDSNEFTLE